MQKLKIRECIIYLKEYAYTKNTSYEKIQYSQKIQT